MDSFYQKDNSGETLMKRKKVLQFIHGFSMGGAEKLVSEYCLKLNKEKYEVSVLCFHRYNTPYEKILEERKYLGEILGKVKTDYWFYGHYHHYYSGTYNEVMYRCLPELEFFLAPEPKNNNPQGHE